MPPFPRSISRLVPYASIHDDLWLVPEHSQYRPLLPDTASRADGVSFRFLYRLGRVLFMYLTIRTKRFTYRIEGNLIFRCEQLCNFRLNSGPRFLNSLLVFGAIAFQNSTVNLFRLHPRNI